MFPKVPMERENLSPEPLVYLFMYVYQRPPEKELSYKIVKT
jgi:hypothetical protein